MAEVKTIKDSTSEFTVAVEVTASEYEKQFDDELSKIARTVKLDGFRQGKVPHSVIKKKFESQCHQKSISYLIDYHSHKISSEKKFELTNFCHLLKFERQNLKNHEKLSILVIFCADIKIFKIK